MVYSHIWDALLKLTSFICFIIAGISLNLEQRMQIAWITPQQKSILGFAAVVAVWLIVYRQCLSIISAWLYARVNLRTSITFTEASELRKLFQLDLSFKWFPLREIRALPIGQRHDALMLTFERLAPARKAIFM
jgi:hypothetical protein